MFRKIETVLHATIRPLNRGRGRSPRGVVLNVPRILHNFEKTSACFLRWNVMDGLYFCITTATSGFSSFPAAARLGVSLDQVVRISGVSRITFRGITIKHKFFRGGPSSWLGDIGDQIVRA